MSQSNSPFSCSGGLPSLSSQPKTVTTPTENQVARSIGGPIYHDVSPSLNRFRSGRSPPVLSNRFETSVHQPEKIATSKLRIRNSQWAVTDENVPTLPEHHPLERTAVFVPHTSAPIVAERITECLKLRSISAEFVVGKRVKAKCLSTDSPPVEFRVFLYRGKKIFSHGIIVEVQRRFGFSINFAADTSAILAAAENKQPSTSSLPLPPLVPLSSEDESFGDENDDSPSFEAGLGMLQSSDVSKRLLGIKFFLSQTDSKKIGASKSSVVTRCLLSQECAVVHDVLAEITLSPDELLRASAVTTWTNMFSSLTKKDLVLVSMHKAFITKHFIPVLIEDVKKAGEKTINANTAVRCLYIMLKNFSDIVMKTILETNDLMNILDNAVEVGRSNHHSLSRYAVLLQGMLERAS